jgi:hypothetical protein
LLAGQLKTVTVLSNYPKTVSLVLMRSRRRYQRRAQASWIRPR